MPSLGQSLASRLCATLFCRAGYTLGVCRLDYQPRGREDRTREDGGNRAKIFVASLHAPDTRYRHERFFFFWWGGGGGGRGVITVSNRTFAHLLTLSDSVSQLKCAISSDFKVFS